jgi:hypothetical protein
VGQILSERQRRSVRITRTIRQLLAEAQLQVLESSAERVVWIAGPEGLPDLVVTTEVFDSARASTTIQLLPSVPADGPAAAVFYRKLNAINGKMHGERLFNTAEAICYSVDMQRQDGESDEEFGERILEGAVQAVDLYPERLRIVLQLAADVGVGVRGLL